MSKPIRITEDLYEKAVEEFKNTLKQLKMTSGKLTYSKEFDYKDADKATILFSPIAYSKMVGLLMSFDTEIAWHGVGGRVNENTFLINDILVYPQTVTGTTVDMDPTEYTKWIMDNITDDRFNNIIMQGHSHVNMSVFASGTDTDHQAKILEQVRNDQFYIFMIWNKRLDQTTKIYDLKNNILYEDKDVQIGIADENVNLSAFLDEARSMVKKVTYSYTAQNKNQSSLPANKGTSAGSTSGYESKPKTTPKDHSWKGRGYDYADDYGQDYYG